MYRMLKWVERILCALPLRVARAFGRGVGLIAFAALRKHRETNLADMARCFPGASRRDLKRRLRRVYQNLAVNYVEVIRWFGGRDAELDAMVRADGMEHVERARERGRGVLVLTAHLGNWDLLGPWAARRVPLTIITKELKNAGANRYWQEARARIGLKLLPAHGSYRACLATLKRGEFLGFILDQNMTRDEGIFVDFFGRPACTTPGLAYLAAHAQSPVLPVFMVREPDGSHRVRILPPLDPPADRRPETIQDATQRYTRIIEDVIRQHPDQWIWMHRRWRTQPLPAPAGPGTT
ncbi:MAG: lysophospholipid acyltransferase family protein [Kiritimatiellae bacterium]|nr:lysophospholipid acyltransferase family protein [Kiritimatiellia bacterium]MDW8457644.1 lysophospholipid acyltransferase family protein [Verrucomicrobiota bacterium]